MKIRVYIFIILIQLFAVSIMFAQETDTLAGVRLDSLINSGQICLDPVSEDMITEEDEIFVTPEIYPEFPGGMQELRNWIEANLEYPKEIKRKRIKGTVYLRFEVTKTGEVGKVEIQKGIHPILDDEAVRIIKSIPNFKPGTENGKPIIVWYSIPITFKLK